jgi:2'-5' RNA ligase
MVKSPWFIAVIPPEDIQEAVTALKREAAARFESRHALKSPPHVTLIPPFVATLDEISSLEGFFGRFRRRPISLFAKFIGIFQFSTPGDLCRCGTQ